MWDESLVVPCRSQESSNWRLILGNWKALHIFLLAMLWLHSAISNHMSRLHTLLHAKLVSLLNQSPSVSAICLTSYMFVQVRCCVHGNMCVSVDQLYRQQWMGGCHVMIHAASVDAHLLPIQITFSESLVCWFKATQNYCSV